MRGSASTGRSSPEHLTDGWASAFRSAGDDLMHLWHAGGAGEGADPDWQTAEFAVHSWDLAHALGRSTAELDPEVAEQGLAFMRANLREEMRGRGLRAGAAGAERRRRLRRARGVRRAQRAGLTSQLDDAAAVVEAATTAAATAAWAAAIASLTAFAAQSPSATSLRAAA